eukprot:23588-Eustigmatos_ZCMA.PRE.1
MLRKLPTKLPQPGDAVVWGVALLKQAGCFHLNFLNLAFNTVPTRELTELMQGRLIRWVFMNHRKFQQHTSRRLHTNI